MARHGVDGAFLQRFAGQLEVDGRTEGGNSDIMRLRDEVGDRVQEAAEQEGRVFAIMYVGYDIALSIALLIVNVGTTCRVSLRTALRRSSKLTGRILCAIKLF